MGQSTSFTRHRVTLRAIPSDVKHYNVERGSTSPDYWPHSDRPPNPPAASIRLEPV